MLKIDNLHADVAGKPILKGLSLAIGAGEIHAIMGPNGAGKSTLAYVLGGRPGYEVTGGSVTFTPACHSREGGNPVRQARTRQRPSRRLRRAAARQAVRSLGPRLRGDDEVGV